MMRIAANGQSTIGIALGEQTAANTTVRADCFDWKSH
jgi:hypothetical protein